MIPMIGKTSSTPASQFTTREEVREVYRRRARLYDLSANLYYLIGFREFAYRKRAVAALKLAPGATVVELGCGTGLNLPLLRRAVGPSGRIIGVDLTDAMLEGARKRISRHRWTNVELVQASAVDYRIPEGVDAVFSAFALTLEPDYDAVIAAAAKAIRPGGRMVVLDLRLPSTPLLRRLAPLLIGLVRPFAVSMEVARRRPWESMERYLKDVNVQDLYFGIAYIAAGRA